MRLNAQPENAFPSAEGSRGTNIGRDKTIDTTGGHPSVRWRAAFYLMEFMKGKVKMNDKERKEVETMLENSDGNIGYAYLYPRDGSARQEFVFEMTPGNIANFIGSHSYDAEKIILTDILDRLILETAGGFIDRCPDQNLCSQILSILTPIRLGERSVQEFPMVTMEAYDEYGQWEDETATAAELGLL